MNEVVKECLGYTCFLSYDNSGLKTRQNPIKGTIVFSIFISVLVKRPWQLTIHSLGVRHSPYSPDWCAAFSCFLNRKFILRERFGDVEGIKKRYNDSDWHHIKQCVSERLSLFMGIAIEFYRISCKSYSDCISAEGQGPFPTRLLVGRRWWLVMLEDRILVAG